VKERVVDFFWGKKARLVGYGGLRKKKFKKRKEAPKIQTTDSSEEKNNPPTEERMLGRGEKKNFKREKPNLAARKKGRIGSRKGKKTHV